MATVLMAWELGDGLGHVQKLLRVARVLKAAGHQPVFALFNVVEAGSLLRAEGFPVIQAPVYHHKPLPDGRPFMASSFADVLAIRGWQELDHLESLVSAWQELLDQVEPALVVGDFCPTLCLTIYRTLPLILVGSWFSLPPGEGIGFPILVPGQPPVVPQDRLLAQVQELQRRRHRPVPPTLHDILEAADTFPVVLPEIDPYRARRAEPTWSPLDPMPVPAPPVEPSFFAYLAADNPLVESILTQLALTGFQGTVFPRNASTEVRDRLRLQGLTVLDRPPSLADMLARHAVIVHHAGLGTTHTALAAGRPQILLPQHLEQTTTAHLLVQLGVGIRLWGNFTPDTAARSLEKIINEPHFGAKALALAQTIKDRPRREPMPAILERCRFYLGDTMGAFGNK